MPVPWLRRQNRLTTTLTPQDSNLSKKYRERKRGRGRVSRGTQRYREKCVGLKLRNLEQAINQSDTAGFKLNNRESGRGRMRG